MSQTIPYLTAQALHNTLNYPDLVNALREGFTKDYLVPPRMHLNYSNQPEKAANTMLLMPAVKSQEDAGVKIITVAPDNSQVGLPSIQGIYYLMDAITGSPKALLEAKTLTNWRTAAASTLASTFLSREDSSSLLLIGTGSLAPYLIEAHAAIRPIKSVMVYGRNKAKAEQLVERFSDQFEQVEAVTDLSEAVQQADIISAATLSAEPLILGSWLRPGQHVDLVGSYLPNMREADDEVIAKGRVYVDNLEMAPKESGDLAIPLASGALSMEDIQGDLFGLCKGEVKGRVTQEEITVFKSVGHALEDLVAAQLVLKTINP
ncbi:MAG: ornithine cyclodeaminase family protein [Cytophagales bacterium]|nr:ornithine cyclodeaminase family protein [Cytophagales bacterium]